MKHFIIFTALVILAATACAQDSIVSTKKIVFNVKLITLQNHRYEGFLTHLSDSTLQVSQMPLPLSPGGLPSLHAQAFGYQDINKVMVHRKGSTGRAILFGGLGGLTLGGLGGLLSGNDPITNTLADIFRTTAAEKALVFGFTGLVTGALFGTVIGLVGKRHFRIGASQEAHLAMKRELIQRITR